MVTVNGVARTYQADPDTPLLWVLREEWQLMGTKYGCGIGVCGTCTVHRDGQPVSACLTPIRTVDGHAVTTIEGLAHFGHVVIRAWIAEQVPQCGYCQSGQIMAAAALLDHHPQPTEADIVAYMAGHLCRCGTYPRIRRAIAYAARL
ncbi:MAG: (2Fe-2S)-binding protein [Acidiferrobacter sp.]